MGHKRVSQKFVIASVLIEIGEQKMKYQIRKLWVEDMDNVDAEYDSLERAESNIHIRADFFLPFAIGHWGERNGKPWWEVDVMYIHGRRFIPDEKAL